MLYYVHFVGYNKRLDEWVTPERIDFSRISLPKAKSTSGGGGNSNNNASKSHQQQQQQQHHHHHHDSSVSIALNVCRAYLRMGILWRGRFDGGESFTVYHLPFTGFSVVCGR